jgi:antitoxin component YwqK of YwqJK toxin-antitoxin module
MKSKLGCFLFLLLILGCARQVQVSDSEWYRSCSIRVSERDGLLHGTYEFFSPENKMQYQGRYVQGKKQGVWTVWESTGLKLAEDSYEDGVKNGPTSLWYGSTYNRGKSAGQIKLQAAFSKGEYHGTLKSYSPDGVLRSEVEFDHGKITRACFFDGKGKAVQLDNEKAVQYAKEDTDLDKQMYLFFEDLVAQSLAYSKRIK